MAASSIRPASTPPNSIAPTAIAPTSIAPTSVAAVIDLAAVGTVKYLHFWGHHGEPGQGVGRGCLSQWWPSAFACDGQTFATAEHYMMWRKAMLFGDVPQASQILAAVHPRDAKTRGREVRGFNQAVWEQQRFEIVVAGSVAKFGQSLELRKYLLGTGERVLVEASPMDRIWGIGLAATDPDASDPARWRGLNLLGFALMKARALLAGGGELAALEV